MNTADSEEMAQPLLARGYVATTDIQEADVAIMNTCTVREHAEHKALSNLGRLREWKAEKPERLLIVAGCAASLWGESLKKKNPHVDIVSPATKIENFPDIIEAAMKARGFTARPAVHSASHQNRTLSNNPFGDSNTAFVTTMRGCNLNCSYCIVPQVRGREKYRPLPEILDEIKGKVSIGFREVMLLGQTVNSYYWRSDTSEVADFAVLLRTVDAIPAVESIRFMSPHPIHMRARVIEAIRDCKKVARHVHLPVQSGSSAVLSRMKRLYTRDEYLDIVKLLRHAIPEIHLTTDVIVGYPGETTADFDDTLSLIKEVGFNSLFAFQYSPRPGTASAELSDDVTAEIKENRLQQVLALAKG